MKKSETGSGNDSVSQSLAVAHAKDGRFLRMNPLTGNVDSMKKQLNISGLTVRPWGR